MFLIRYYIHDDYVGDVIYARMCDIIEPQLLGVQSDFCAEWSTKEQTMALHCILDMCRVSKHMTTIIFFDFHKAFDGHAISMVLSEYGMSELLIANVVQFYIGTSAVVATAHRNTEDFSTTSGVLQVDTLHLSSSSPYLTTFFVKCF